MKKIAAEKQVFCITHLPQIAGKAISHFVVFKTVKEKRTYSSIRELSEQERVEEIARMSGGKKITEVTLSHAIEMIQPKLDHPFLLVVIYQLVQLRKTSLNHIF